MKLKIREKISGKGKVWLKMDGGTIDLIWTNEEGVDKWIATLSPHKTLRLAPSSGFELEK